MSHFAEVIMNSLNLPKPEKLKLARILLADAEEDETVSGEEIEQAWENEIERRIESVKNGTAETIDAEEVFAELNRQK